MHVSRGTQTTNPHSYPKSALKDKATTQLHRQGLRRYSRFQFPDWSMQNFSINVLLAYFLWNLLQGENNTGFQRNISMKWLYTNIWRMPDIAKLVWTPTSGKFYPAEQISAIGQRRRRGGEESWIFFCPWLQTGEPRSFHSLCRPRNLACNYNSPMAVTQKPHQPVCQHGVCWHKPLQQQSLAYSAITPSRSHTMGEEVDLPSKVSHWGRRKAHFQVKEERKQVSRYCLI